MSRYEEVLCLKCGNLSKPDYQLGGSFIFELILWLVFLLPGLLYSIHRITTAKKSCPTCKSGDVIPAYTPKAKEIIVSGKSARGPSGTKSKDQLVVMAMVNAVVAIAIWAGAIYLYNMF